MNDRPRATGPDAVKPMQNRCISARGRTTRFQPVRAAAAAAISSRLPGSGTHGRRSGPPARWWTQSAPLGRYGPCPYGYDGALDEERRPASRPQDAVCRSQPATRGDEAFELVKIDLGGGDPVG